MSERANEMEFNCVRGMDSKNFGATGAMKPNNDMIQKILELAEQMSRIADEGDEAREDAGCGVLFGVVRDSAYKIRKMAEEELEAHTRKGCRK